MKKYILLCFMFILLCFIPTISFAEENIEDFITEELIYQDKYLTSNEQGKLQFLNDVFTYYNLPVYDDMTEIYSSIVSSWNKIQYTIQSIRWLEEFYIPRKNYFTLWQVQKCANKSLTVLVAKDTNNIVDIYFVHPSNEDLPNNIIYTSTVSNQNWYKLKTQFNNLKRNYATIEAYYIPYPQFSSRNETAYANVDSVNVRLKPTLLQNNIFSSLSFGTQVSIIGENDLWYKIKVNNSVGYVYKSYLTIGIYATPTPKPTPTPAPTATPRPTTPLTPKPRAEQFVNVLKAQLGKPYVGGGIGPKYFDCSGLVYYAFKSLGYPYQRTNADSYARMGNWSYFYNRAQLQMGDLVFFYNDARSRIQHIGVYVGNNNIIHASSGSGKVVISSLSSNWLNKHYAWACKHTSFL